MLFRKISLFKNLIYYRFSYCVRLASEPSAAAAALCSPIECFEENETTCTIKNIHGGGGGDRARKVKLSPRKRYWFFDKVEKQIIITRLTAEW